MTTASTQRPHKPRTRLPLVALFAASLLALGAALLSGSVAWASPPTASAAAGLATPARAKPAVKQCVVHMKVNGRLVAATRRVWVYRYIIVKGKRRRVIRQVSVPLYAGCKPAPCAKQQTVKGKLVLVTHLVWMRVQIPRRGRLVWVRQRVRTPVIVACPKPPPPAPRCAVHQSVNGRLVAVTQRVWVYRYITVKGKRRRVIRQVSVPLYAGCKPAPCAKQQTVKGKLVLVTHLVWMRVQIPRRGQLVWVRQRIRTPVIVACPKKTVTPPPSLGTPVTITIEPGSTATLDFVAFQRQAALSGSLKGYLVGGFHVGGANQIILTGGSITIAQTPVFIDNLCNGQVSAAIRTGNPATISLDQTRQSTTNVSVAGAITSLIYTKIRLPLQLRNGDTGCNQPYLNTGYDEEQAALFLGGRFTGLTGIKLRSAPEDIQFGACVALGSPTSPCTGFEIPIDVLVSTDLVVGLTLGS